MGICGGMQMLGDMIRDPLGVESDQVEVQGLGILDVDREFVGDKLTTRDRCQRGCGHRTSYGDTRREGVGLRDSRWG